MFRRDKEKNEKIGEYEREKVYARGRKEAGQGEEGKKTGERKRNRSALEVDAGLGRWGSEQKYSRYGYLPCT